MGLKVYRQLWIVIWLALMAVVASSSTAATALPVSGSAHERVAELIQGMFGSYREATSTNDPGTNSPLTNTNIERGFRAAAALLPQRLDLRFGIATALVGQALETNAPFASRMSSALEVYEEIQALDRGGFYAPVLRAAYRRAMGDTNAAKLIMNQLLASHPERARAYLDRFSRIEEIWRLVPNTRPYGGAPVGKEHAIVILGAALETNSLIKPKLVDRLRQGLTLARLYPDAPIVVTGGNAKGGLTEAYAMGLWLRQEGVSTNRLYLEDQARDTVGNAFKSCDILRKLGARSATLVTSASHMRRALASFEEAARQRALAIEFFHLAAKDEPPVDAARERVSIYRDVMRASGIWAYPGIQQ